MASRSSSYFVRPAWPKWPNGAEPRKKEVFRRASPKSIIAYTESRRLVVRVVRLFGDTQKASLYVAGPPDLPLANKFKISPS
jgi:hypothetical protein